MAVVRKKRPAGTGSIYERGGRWVGEYRARDGTSGRQVRRRIFGASQTEIERELGAIIRGRRRSTPVFTPAPSRVPAPRSTRLAMVERALADAERLGWDRAFTARVIVASTTPVRIRMGVYGPCFFCGDWTANTVDHLTPRSRGGGDNPGNLASACDPCNSRKGTLTAAEFAGVPAEPWRA